MAQQGFRFEQFVPAGSPGDAAALAQLPDLLPPSAPQRLCVLASNAGVKFSLLMNCAYSKASASDRVLFVASTSRPRSNLLLAGSVDPLDARFELIRLRYLNTASEYAQFFSSIHLLENADIPGVVIVDGLLSATEGQARGNLPGDRDVALRLALLVDAVRHLSDRRQKTVALVVGLPPKQQLCAIQRYFPCALEIVEDAHGGAWMNVAAAPCMALTPSLRSARIFLQPAGNFLQTSSVLCLDAAS